MDTPDILLVLRNLAADLDETAKALADELAAGEEGKDEPCLEALASALGPGWIRIIGEELEFRVSPAYAKDAFWSRFDELTEWAQRVDAMTPEERKEMAPAIRAVVKERAYYLRHLADMLEEQFPPQRTVPAQDMPDIGPAPLGRFAWQGKLIDMAPGVWRLAGYLWDSERRTFRTDVPFQELADNIWRQEHTKEETIRGAVHRLSEWGLKHELPFDIGTKGSHVIITPLPPPA